LPSQQRAQMKDTIKQELDRGSRLTAPEIADAETKRSLLFSRIGQLMESTTSYCCR